MTVLIRGIKRVQSQPGLHLIWLIITASMLRCIKGSLAEQPLAYKNILLWAACCTDYSYNLYNIYIIIDNALFQAGFDPSLFKGHSFRIGAATTANLVGVPETIIKILGHWKITAYQHYIRPPQAELALVSSCS